MAKDYTADKAAKRKTGQKALWFLIILLILVVGILIRVTLTGSLTRDVFSGLPSSDEAYTVAKEFIKPTLKSNSIEFKEGLKFGKTSDSVYVIQSSVDSKNETGEKVTTDFKIIMKYNGGEATREKNWSLVNLSTY